MFDNFDTVYSDAFTLDELNRLGIVDGEIGRLLYGEYRIIYMQREIGFVIGYTGAKMLIVDFRLDYSRSQLIIEEIQYANGQEINNLYCRPTCRNDGNRS